MAHQLSDDGIFPNSRLPLLIYSSTLDLREGDAASKIESILAGNGWCGSWRNGIYGYHHYHSTAHEVLVCYRGKATVQFGGERGVTATLQAGDAVVIPVGVAHKRLDATRDFAVVGAYPAGQDSDMNYGKAGERPKADENIARVPLPETDPLFGEAGPLVDHWRARQG